MSKPIRLNLEITLQPETPSMVSLATLVLDNRLVCHTLPLSQALICLEEELELRLEEKQNHKNKPSTHL